MLIMILSTSEVLWDMYCYLNAVLLLFLVHFNCILLSAKLKSSVSPI